VLGGLTVPHDPRVLIDYRTQDDAGVYSIDENLALVQTVDFFTPIVDDPYGYGQIAAANALSDIYAMGGRPITALAIGAFPVAEIGADVIRDIFAGGLDMLRSAGVALLGGHTLRDHEVKFGYAVTGVVRPDRVWSNAGARVGDRLLLTKPLGTGIVTTAIKFGRAPEPLASEAIASMSMLNRAAAGVLASENGVVGGCTDVTGFGLLGHATEMAAASGVTLRIEMAGVPVFRGVQALVSGNTTGGGATNREHFGAGIDMPAAIDETQRALLYDPQTSGGLLVTIRPARLERVHRALADAGVQAAVVGTVEPRRGPFVTVAG
jgi:selenide,water dikinase